MRTNVRYKYSNLKNYILRLLLLLRQFKFNSHGVVTVQFGFKKLNYFYNY